MVLKTIIPKRASIKEKDIGNLGLNLGLMEHIISFYLLILFSSQIKKQTYIYTHPKLRTYTYPGLSKNNRKVLINIRTLTAGGNDK